MDKLKSFFNHDLESNFKRTKKIGSGSFFIRSFNEGGKQGIVLRILWLEFL